METKRYKEEQGDKGVAGEGNRTEGKSPQVSKEGQGTRKRRRRRLLRTTNQ